MLGRHNREVHALGKLLSRKGEEWVCREPLHKTAVMNSVHQEHLSGKGTVREMHGNLREIRERDAKINYEMERREAVGAQTHGAEISILKGASALGRSVIHMPRRRGEKDGREKPGR